MREPKKKNGTFDHGEIRREIDSITDYLGKIVLLNAGFSNNLGLLNGTMGAAIFLYHLDKKKDNPFFYDFANSLIVSMNDRINLTDSYYSNGSTGIALGMKYLCKNDFIGDDGLVKMLYNFDDFCLTRTSCITPNVDFFGILSYLITRTSEEDFFNSKSLRFLLMNERIISQITLLMKSISKENQVDEFFMKKSMFSLERIEALIFEMDFHCRSAKALIGAGKNKIFPEIGEQLILTLDKKIAEHLETLGRFILRHDMDDKTSTLFGAVCRLYHAHLLLRAYLSLDVSFDFSGFIMTLNSKNEKLFYRSSPIFGLNYDVLTIVALFRINNINQKSDLEEIIDLKLLELVKELCRQRSFNRLLSKDSQPINLGLSGISGVGMVLLEWCMPEIASWDQSLIVG